MKYQVDTHTHTLVSGHAYSTLQEMVAAAKEKELSIIGITEHARMMPGTCNDMYFRNLRVVPKEIDGVKVLVGVELNIMNDDGELDMSEDTMSKLDVRIASVHDVVYHATDKKRFSQCDECGS